MLEAWRIQINQSINHYPAGYWYELQQTDRLEPRSVNLQETPLVDSALTVEERKTNLVDRVRIELAGREGVVNQDGSDPGRDPLDQFNPYGLTYPGREIYVQDKELYAGKCFFMKGSPWGRSLFVNNK